ncbi:tape measure protein [Mesorhizobium sp. M0955]|uniref:tape measure protein n=1 Tax=Mesorhizobium sp. M0955 TaxID=2957033 RepID=UPI003335D783
MAAIRVELELADGSFTTRMLHAGESVERFNQNVGRSSPALAALAANGQSVVRSISLADNTTKSFLSTLRDVALIAGIVSIGISKIANIQHSWIGDIVRINAEMERLNFQMRSMSRAADPIKDAGDQVAYLREQALKMPFSLQSITNGFVKLKSTGLDPMDGSLQSIADGVAAFGGSDEAFNRTILAISQMSGKGVIQMEELRQQLGESMPRAVELMARSMGVSMAQLIKSISTGTVQAKPALQLFYDELERTYGGRARTMMQTFSGQYQAAVTQIQRLATSGALKNDFFGSIKDQLRDLNSFLNSRGAAQFADDLGHSLATAVRWLRSGVDTLIEFRNEIGRFAVVAGGAFALRTAISGITTFVGALGTLRTELRATSIALGAMAEQRTLLTIMLNSGAPAATVLSQRLTLLRGTVGALATGVAALAPWVVALGLAAYGAAEYFGVFSDKVGDAYANLVKYGAETRKQAKEISDAYIQQIELQIQKEKEAELARGENLKEDVKGNLVPDENYGPLYLLNQKLLKAREDADRLYGEAAKREDDKVVEAARASLDERFTDLQGDRDRRLDLLQRQFDEEQKTAKNSEDLAQRRAQAIYDVNKEFYQKQIDILNESVAAEEKAGAGASGARVAQSKKILDMLYADLTQYRERLDSLKIGEVPTLVAPKSGASLLEKAQKDLMRVRGEVEGLVEEFGGANRAVAQLQQMMRDGKYGDMGRAAVMELTDKLVAATAAKEKLDELMKGKKQLASDIQNATMRALDKQMELQEKAAGRDLTDAEKIKIRIENGYYAGFGPNSPTREMLRSLLKGFDLQGEAANEIGDILRNNTFGSVTENRIQTVTDKLREMAGVINGIGGGLNGLNFGKISMSGDSFFGGAARIMGSAGTLLDLIAKMESGGDYNATLDNGKWTGGSQNLIGMTLNQILELQKQMLANPDNRATYHDNAGNPVGSSALGRYQITSATLKTLIQEMGLSGNELYDRDMQDRLATALIDRRSGQGVDGLRNEWEGLRNIDPATIMAALAGQQYAPAHQTAPAQAGAPAIPTYTPGAAETSFLDDYDAGVKRINDDLAKLNALNEQNNKDGKKQDLIDANKEIAAQIEAQKLNSDDLNKNYEKFVALIKQGKLGDSKDPKADEYKELLANAKELDRVERDAAARKKALGSADRAEETLKQKQIDLSRRLAEANARITDPLEQKTTSAFRAMRTELDDYIRDVEAYYGKDSAEYRAALDYKAQMLRQFTNTETAEKAAGWAKSARDTRRGLLTERQARTQAMQEEIAQIDAAVSQFRGTEEEKIQIVAAAEERKAAIRAQYAREMSPMSAMMQQWGDLQGNLTQQSTQWMNSLADGLTGLVTGTGDLKSVVDGMLKDIVNMGIKYIMSQMMGAKGGGGAKGGAAKIGGAVGKGGGAKGGGLKKFGVAHTGAMVGATTMARAVSPNVFKGAKTYHGGGQIGGRRLAPGEVPIIAREGEGIYTPEQLAEGYRRSQTSSTQQFNMPVSVTVNAAGGTPEQNADLARQTARETKEAVRAMVVAELIDQTRPGGIMAAGTRRY